MRTGSVTLSTVDKALTLLSFFTSDRATLSLKELSEQTGYSKTTTYRLINVLIKHNFLARANGAYRDPRYRLGFAFLSFAALLKEQLEVRRVALPYMWELRNQVGESVQLVVVDDVEGVYIEVMEALNPVRLYIRPGRRAPLYAGASTRLLLAWLPAERRDEILRSRPPIAHTPNTITEMPKLLASLQQCREQGYALSRGELQLNSAELAVPLFNYAGEVVAALSIAGPDHSYTDDKIPHLLEQLKKTATKISREMGYRGG